MLPPTVLEKFYETGFLSLSDAQISLDYIYHLKEFSQYLRKDQPKPSDYGINLSHIVVMLDALPQPQEHVIAGSVIEHSSRDWRESYADATLGQMASTRGFHTPFNVRDPKEDRKTRLNKLKESLVSLLDQSWSSIRLENVFIYENNQIDYSTTESFYTRLLESLAKNTALRVLTLKPFSFISHGTTIVDFLIENTYLQRLRLQTTEADKQGWQELCHVVSKHPNLEYFHLDTSILDANAYSALIELLDENYHIKLSVPAPIDNNLLEVYQPLKQRLSKSGFERFKEDHLSQDRLLQVAVDALEMTQAFKSSDTDQIKTQDVFKQRFDFLIANEGQLAITDSQKENWIENANVLPKVYQRHQDYLIQTSDLVQLQMDASVANGYKTIGYILLEKALETQNQSALRALLHANANLFEFPDNNEEPFLVKALQNKGDLKRTVVKYIQQNLRLVTLAEECLDAYPELKNLFKNFKNHLDKYGSYLVKKDNPSILLSISKNILFAWRKILDFENPSGARGKECAQLYLSLDKSLEIIAHSSEGATYDSFDEVHKIIIKMKEDSMRAVRGAFNSSFLHEEALELIGKFEIELMKVKKKVVNETLKNKDNEIKQLRAC